MKKMKMSSYDKKEEKGEKTQMEPMEGEMGSMKMGQGCNPKKMRRKMKPRK